MRLFITCDIAIETKVDKARDAICDTEFRRFFDEKTYGTSIEGISLFLMCRAPYLKFKQRIRFLKKEKKLYMDIMLDYNQFINVEQAVRNRIVVEKLIIEVPQIIAKYKFKDFDLPEFEKDFKRFLKKAI